MNKKTKTFKKRYYEKISFFGDIAKKWWSKDYSIPSKNINWGIFITFLIPFFVGLGYIYLLSLLGKFGIPYEVFFNPKDCIKVLYDKGIVFVYIFSYISLLLFFSMLVMLPIHIFIKKYLPIMVYFVFCIFIYMYLKGEKIPLKNIMITFFVFSICILLFKCVNWVLSFLVLVSFLFLGFRFLGEIDAKKIATEKLTFNIFLKNKDTILSEHDKSSFFIYKTFDYIFIKDEENDKIIITPVSEIETISFNRER